MALKELPNFHKALESTKTLCKFENRPDYPHHIKNWIHLVDNTVYDKLREAQLRKEKAEEALAGYGLDVHAINAAMEREEL
jgi:tRNA(His) 5'-end guanylyltransferase